MKRAERYLITIIIFLTSIAGIWYYSWDHTSQNDSSFTFIEDFQQVDKYPLYIASYIGDYKFNEYLETGRRPILGTFGCTCFAVDGIVGRNFDFPANPALLLFTAPKNGYKSISMVDLGYFGYSMNYLPLDPTGLEETPFMPFDGMNEKGLVVAMAAIPYAGAPFSPEKVSIGEIAVIRLLLDYAATVDEAVELLGKYNVDLTDPPIHYLVTDASGESAIIEFLDDEMIIYRSFMPQVITNFLVTGVSLPEESPCRRYDSVFNGIASEDGDISIDYSFQLLKASSQSSTIWSTVYDIENLIIHIAMGGDYNHVHSFCLE